MILRLLVAAAGLTATIFLSSSARADDTTSDHVMLPSHAQLETGAEAGVLSGVPVGGLRAGLLFGVDRRWSVGVTGSGLMLPLVFGVVRADVEGRYHPTLGRWGGLWVGGGAGVGYVFSGSESGYGPHVAASAGADVRPFSFLSLGVQARAGLYVFSLPQEGAHPYPEASLSLVIGFHLPKSGESEPARAVAAR